MIPKDNDLWEKNCAEEYKGAWWYKHCHSSNLNAHNYGTGESTPDGTGISWETFNGDYDSLRSNVMTIRPYNCPIDDPNYASIGGTCYYFDTIPRTKLEAKETCTQNNGKIWEPNTVERINQVRSIAQEISKAKEWWVGISGAASEETFKYDSNEEIFPFTPNTAPWINLDGGGLTENCVCMDNNQNSLQFYDVPCTEGRQYHSICEISSSPAGDSRIR